MTSLRDVNSICSNETSSRRHNDLQIAQASIPLTARYWWGGDSLAAVQQKSPRCGWIATTHGNAWISVWSTTKSDSGRTFSLLSGYKRWYLRTQMLLESVMMYVQLLRPCSLNNDFPRLNALFVRISIFLFLSVHVTFSRPCVLARLTENS